jgi:hypothetical protein
VFRLSRLALVAAPIAVVLLFAMPSRVVPVEAALTLNSTDIPRRSAPLIVGAGVHFGIGGEYNYIPVHSAEALKRLGIETFRDDLPWSAFDAPGVSPVVPQPAKLFGFMKLSDAKPLLILGHPNANVPHGSPPLGDEGIAAFTDFVHRAVQATKPYAPTYEIWNEWNLNAVRTGGFLVGEGLPEDPRAAIHYAALAKASTKAVREVTPDATVLVGAAGMDPAWQWTRAIVREGALEGATGLSVHLYNHCDRADSRRTATEIVDRISELHGMLREDTGRDVPLYVTEFGWPTATKQCVISQETAADNIAQFLLWSAATDWIKGIWIYQLKDQGPDPALFEENFGLVAYRYEDKPAACAVQQVMQLLKDQTSFRVLRPAKDVFLLEMQRAGGLRVVAWTTATLPKGQLKLPSKTRASVRSLCRDTATNADGTVTFGAEPAIIDIDGVNALDVQLTQPN